MRLALRSQQLLHAAGARRQLRSASWQLWRPWQLPHLCTLTLHVRAQVVAELKQQHGLHLLVGAEFEFTLLRKLPRGRGEPQQYEPVHQGPAYANSYILSEFAHGMRARAAVHAADIYRGCCSRWVPQTAQAKQCSSLRPQP